MKTRCSFILIRGFKSLICFATLSTAVPASEPDVINIGSRLELFADRHLIDSMSNEVTLKLHKPKPQEVVLTTDKPWEGNTCAYYTIFRDGDLFRMYYRGSHWDEQAKKAAHAEVTCYAESHDGIHWTKPELGLFDFEGSKKNNIVWNGVGTHCFTVFKDTNPKCPQDARYKAISRGRPTHAKGLYVFKSPDAIHWTLISEKPVITDGAFDSQNLAFWDTHRKQYREYHRIFRNGVRSITTGTSDDFVNWTAPIDIKLPDTPNEHLYTNAVQPYERASHLLLGFPTRYLPKEGQRVEPTFMISRDRETFHRWTEAVIPESAPKDRGGNRSNYMTWGLVRLPSNDREYSVYATEAYYTGPDSRVRRFTYRVDGFVSAHAGSKAGSLITKPLQFYGTALALNLVTKNVGSVNVEIQNAAGKPIKGFSLNECIPLTGDEIQTDVRWTSNAKLASLAGRAVRIRFEIENADLYSFRFVTR